MNRAVRVSIPVLSTTIENIKKITTSFFAEAVAAASGNENILKPNDFVRLLAAGSNRPGNREEKLHVPTRSAVESIQDLMEGRGRPKTPL